MEHLNSITVIGRRCFNARVGTTYHSAQILVNGKPVYKIDFEYGYGDQYLWHAYEWLEREGYLMREQYANGMPQAPWRHAQQHGYSLAYSATDVRRKKDL